MGGSGNALHLFFLTETKAEVHFTLLLLTGAESLRRNWKPISRLSQGARKTPKAPGGSGEVCEKRQACCSQWRPPVLQRLGGPVVSRQQRRGLGRAPCLWEHVIDAGSGAGSGVLEVGS